MRKHPVLVAGAALAAALALTWWFSPSLRAQISGLIPPSFNGGETWVIQLQGPGGSSEYTTTGMVRNTVGAVTTSATSGTVTWPGSSSLNSAGAQYRDVITTAACGGTATFNLPAKPFDGQIVEIINGSGSAYTTGCVVATTDGSTIQGTAALGTLAAAAHVEYIYVLATNTWYKKQ
jgi:hypothetical protein